MGTLLKATYTAPLPPDAIVRGGTVIWTAKGRKRTGKLSGYDKVLCQSEIWVAQFIDENGKVKRVSTKTKDKAAANKILVRYESEVDRIRAGAVTRQEIDRYATSDLPIKSFLDKFKTKMTAGGAGQDHIIRTLSKIELLFEACDIQAISDFEHNRIVTWVANETTTGVRAPRTINSYIIAAKSFSKWCVENNFLAANPMKGIKKLNEAVDRRKSRRSLTEVEIGSLLDAAKTRPYRKKSKGVPPSPF